MSLSFLCTSVLLCPLFPTQKMTRALCFSLCTLQELRQLQSQTTGDVSVEVNAAPGQDLTKILNDLRNEYEQIIEKNRREVEQWYEVKVRTEQRARWRLLLGESPDTPRPGVQSPC